MAVKDGERYVEKAVRSVLGQTLRNFELIVVDDGSSDMTPEILDRFADARMRVITQPNHGLAESLNKGVRVARSSLIARMDADDIAEPERLERQVSFMMERPEVGLLGTAALIIDEKGTQVRQWTPPLDDAVIRRELIRANQFAHPSVMFRKDVFEAVGGYADMPYAQDYDLWLRMAGCCKLANLPEPLVRRRETEGQFGTGRETEQVRWAVKARVGALKRGDYPPVAARHLLKPGIAAAMPGKVRELARRITRQKAA
jgi:glycosyltransferase involved in cell wall biosynthesis